MKIYELEYKPGSPDQGIIQAIEKYSANKEGWNADEGYRTGVKIGISNSRVVSNQEFVDALIGLGQDWLHEDDVEELSEFHNIHPHLRSFSVPISSINIDSSNARLHSDRNIRSIEESLSRFSQRQPVVVQRSSMVVRAGNGRVQAAKNLGWTHIAALVVSDTDPESIAYAIADNRTSELGAWNYDQLVKLFEEINMEDMGSMFSKEEIEEISDMVVTPNFPTSTVDIDEGFEPVNVLHFVLKPEEKEAIKGAIQEFRRQNDGELIKDGTILAEICKKWLGI